MRTFRATKRYLVLATIGLALLTGACGKHKDKGDDVASLTGNKANPSASASTSDEDFQAQAEKFQKCMKDHGVEVHMAVPGDDDGGPVTIQSSHGPNDPAEPSKEQMDKAMEACRQYAPNGGEPEQLDPETLEQVRKYSQCMRDHGIKDFPDPDSGGRMSVMSTPGSDMDPNNATFKAAEAACRSLQPSPKMHEQGAK
jgi:hypothetical protein